MKIRWLVTMALGAMACASHERAPAVRTAEPPAGASELIVIGSCDDGSTVSIEAHTYLEPRSEVQTQELVARQCLMGEFAAFVDERQQCATDQQCVRVETWCPFENGVAVAAEHAEAVKEKYREVSTEYAKFSSCKYKYSRLENTICRNNRCALDDRELRRRRAN